MRLWKSLVVLIIAALLLPTLPAAAQDEPPAPVPLQVTSVTPSDGATEVSVAGTLTVSFNRPVVPLTGVDDQAGLPQPLLFEPEIEGEGQWLTTSIYQFAPATGWAGATEYTVTVTPLTAVGGEQMEDAYTFAFTTAIPTVLSAEPQGSQVDPNAVVTVRFSQPMDRATTEDAFDLYLAGSDIVMSGETGWNEAGTTLTFTPTEPLLMGESFTIYVADFAQPVSQQGTLAEGYESTFTVVPLPAITNSTPSDGAEGVPPEQQVRIQFASPMSYTTLMAAIDVAPALTNTTVYSYYNEWDGQLILEWNKQHDTEYTVTIGGDAEDRYGNALGGDYTLTFTTGDYSPFVRVDLEQFTHFTPSAETYVSLFYRNMQTVDVALYRLSIADFANTFSGDGAWEAFQSYAGSEDDLVWRRSYPADDGRNETYQRILTLNDAVNDDPETTAGAALDPGLYVLVADLPEVNLDSLYGMEPPSQSVHVIAISEDNLLVKKSGNADSLVWLTEMESGQPVAGATVDFHAPATQSGFNLDLASAETGEDGSALVSVPFPTESPWFPLVATVGEPGDPNFAIGSSAWSNGIASWDFNINGGYSLEPVQGVFYTDRPIYRPGQTVYWKGIVRRFVDDGYLLPDPTLPISITIRDDRGNNLWQQAVPFDDMGTVNGALALADDATTGYYYLEAVMPTGPGTNFWGGVGFQVAAYEKPEFSISVEPDQESYIQGETMSVRVEAAYFSGGALAESPVTWRVIADPYTFIWEDAPAGRWFSFTPFDPENENYDPYRSFYGLGLVKEGTGVTDAEGVFTLTLPADLGDSLQSQQWTIDFTVQSPTNQFVNAQTRVPIHRGAFYVGLSAREQLAMVGDESTIDVATVTPSSEMAPGIPVEVSVYEFRWNSVQEKTAAGTFVWQTSYERIPVANESVATGSDGMAEFTWTPAKAGQYQIVAQAEDDAGNAISSATFLWVADEDPTQVTAWPRENNDRIELVSDRQEYAPGDTARILVPNPFAGTVLALVTIERSGVDSAEVIELEGSSRTIEVPITSEMIPNAFVSVVLVKGIDETNPAPANRVGMVQLTVDVAERVLDIDVQVATPETPTEQANTRASNSGEPPRVRPGESVTYTLTVVDNSGAPVGNAAVSVALIDKALMTLGSYQNPALVDAFYRQRPLGVTTGSTLIINRDRVSQQLGEGAKGGGGGGGEGMLAVREEFPDTALWEATLLSDADGKITFGLALPDSLTTWELRVWAVTADTRVGEQTHDLVVSKELQVRPILPRFFTAGDSATIGALVLNTTASDAPDTSLSFTLEGATAQGETDLALDLAANGSARFDLPITVDAATDTLTVTIAAESATLADAVRMTLPVLRYQSPETVATSGQVDAEMGSVTEEIAVPEEATTDGALAVRVEPSLAAGLFPSLDYLQHFPWECTEQTVSRFLPNLATLTALGVAGSEELAASLAEEIGPAVQSLVNRQNADGGWGYWPGEISATYVSAYALWGLAVAQELNYAVPDYVIDRAVAFLDRRFVAPDDATDWQLNEMAFTHYVLAWLGDADPGRMSTLYDLRERLQAYGKGWLALALFEADPADARVQTLLDDLAATASVSATGAWWQEPETHFHTLNTNTRSTAIVLDAFAQIRPDEPILPNVVRWLMSQREHGGVWSNTQENAWGIFALTDWLVATGEMDAEYDWSVILNGAEAASGAVSGPDTLQAEELRVAVADLLRDAPNLLTLERSEGPGALYYTAALEYWLDAPDIEPRDRGIVVERTFSVNGELATSAQVGDLISVTVTVVAPTDLNQVLVDVPIPAGTEIVDPNVGPQQFDEFGNPINTWRPNQWMPTYRDFRDERVALFDSLLPAGTHQYSFQVRATLPGEFRVLPARAEMLYFREVWGRSGGAVFSVTPGE